MRGGIQPRMVKGGPWATRCSRAQFHVRIGFTFLTFSTVKPRSKSEAIFKTYELFIYGDTHHITDSFCYNMLKMSTI